MGIEDQRNKAPVQQQKVPLYEEGLTVGELIETEVVDLSGDPDHLYLAEGLAHWIELMKWKKFYEQKSRTERDVLKNDDNAWFEHLQAYKARRDPREVYDEKGEPVSLHAKVRDRFSSGGALWGHDFPYAIQHVLDNYKKVVVNNNLDPEHELDEQGTGYRYIESVYSASGSLEELLNNPDFHPTPTETPPPENAHLQLFADRAEEIEHRAGAASTEAKELIEQAYRAGMSDRMFDVSPHFSQFAEALYTLTEKNKETLPEELREKLFQFLRHVGTRSLELARIDAEVHGRISLPRHVLDEVRKGIFFQSLIKGPGGLVDPLVGLDLSQEELDNFFGMSDDVVIPFLEFAVQSKIQKDWAPRYPSELALILNHLAQLKKYAFIAFVNEGDKRGMVLESIGTDALQLTVPLPKNYDLIKAEARQRFKSELQDLSVGKGSVPFGRTRIGYQGYPKWFHYTVERIENGDETNAVFEIRPK